MTDESYSSAVKLAVQHEYAMGDLKQEPVG
jgi:hypothetical protein